MRYYAIVTNEGLKLVTISEEGYQYLANKHKVVKSGVFNSVKEVVAFFGLKPKPTSNDDSERQ